MTPPDEASILLHLGICARHGLSAATAPVPRSVVGPRRHRLPKGFARAWVLLAVLLLSLPALAQEAVRVRATYLFVDRARQVALARGDAVVTYGDLILRAQEVELNLDSLELVASGGVTLEEAGQVISAQSLTYNLRTRFGSLTQAETRWTSPRLQGPLHLRADRLEGNPNQRAAGRFCQVTTCDLDDPQVPYKLEAREFELIPQDRLVLRHASLYLFGRKVLTLPYFVVFLREPRQQRIFPVVGWNETEGWSVKTATTYELSEEHLGFVYLDWMERIGTGVGFEHLWKYGAGEGDYFAYVLGNRPASGTDYRLRLAHRHDFGGGLGVGAFVDLHRRHSPVAPFTNLYLTLDALYRDPEQAIATFLSYSSSEQLEGYSDSLQVRASYDRFLDPTRRLRVELPFSQFLAHPSRDLELVPRVDYVHFGPGYTLQATLEHRLDLDADSYPLDTYYSLSRLPELAYTFLAQPLQLGSVALNTQLTGGFGLFGERNVFRDGQLGDVWGVRLDTQALAFAYHVLGSQTAADLRSVVRFGYYTTGQARVVFTSTLGIQHQWTQELTSRLSHTYYDRAGETPFQFDQDPTRLNLLQLQTTYRTANLEADLLAGWNFLVDRPDLVTLRTRWLPALGWTVDLATSYDLNLSQLGPVEVQVQARLSDQWELLYRGSYLPTGQLQHDRFQLTYLQYCWAARLSYLASRQEIWLEAWLTALPQSSGAVGLGQTGVLFQQPFLPPSPTR